MRAAGLLAAALWLAACGVNGAPTRPEGDAPVSVTVTGTADVGVTGGSN